MAGEVCGWVDGLVIGTGSLLPQPNELSEALDSDLYFTMSGDQSWYTTGPVNEEYYYDGDAARSGDFADDEEACLQTIVDSDSSETLKFYWKVSSEQDADYLEFYIDNQLQDSISGEVDWTLKTYSISAGPHTLKWRYIKNGSGKDGDDMGWVDFVQWTGSSPDQDPEDWETIAYKYDVEDRRSEKKVNGYSTRYVYDGDQVIAEYDGNNNLLRKYIYGPGVDKPVSMIEVADANATYYYHFDALGSVVALSDSDGDTVQTYEYSVYGEVAVEDANHPNPYMFAGRRYDIEIGLYYNRARYYNPYMGRFLQTDSVGYDDGMNLYRYCMNNPLNYLDPGGNMTWGQHPFLPVELNPYTKIRKIIEGLVEDVDPTDTAVTVIAPSINAGAGGLVGGGGHEFVWICDQGWGSVAYSQKGFGTPGVQGGIGIILHIEKLEDYTEDYFNVTIITPCGVGISYSSWQGSPTAISIVFGTPGCSVTRQYYKLTEKAVRDLLEDVVETASEECENDSSSTPEPTPWPYPADPVDI